MHLTRRRTPVARSVIAVLLAGCLAFVGACTRGSEDSQGSGGSRDHERATAAHQQSPSPTPSKKPALSWGPTRTEYTKARRIVDGLSLQRKAGQVIVASYSGYEAPTSLLRRLHLGGVILMDNNIDSAGQVRRTTTELQRAATEDGRSWPAMIGVDQEGGEVARLGSLVTEMPAYMSLGAADDEQLAAKAARTAGEQLRALGFTVVFAPDADVTSGPDDPTIGTRSAGDDPHLVGRTVRGSLRGYADSGITPVAKHFPGHGSVPADSHESMPVQDASLAELAERDLVPFQQAVDGGLPATMLAHIDVRAVDPGTPATTSRPVVQKLLRQRVGFKGVAFTDAMNMGAITERYGTGQGAVQALAAGSDVLLMPADAEVAHEAIVNAVDEGDLPERRLDQAATRSIAMSLHQDAQSATEKSRSTDTPQTSKPRGADAVAERVALAGATMVEGECSGRLVADAVQARGGTAEDRRAFASAARAAGLQVGSGDVVSLLGSTDSYASGDVVVSLAEPYALGDVDASTKIALYDRTPAAFRALVRILTGKAQANGSLPVQVEGVESDGCG